MMHIVFRYVQCLCLLCVLAAPNLLAAGHSGAGPVTLPPGPSNPAALLPAIMRAYRTGKGIFIIPPGVYKLPQPQGGFYWSFNNMRNSGLSARASHCCAQILPSAASHLIIAAMSHSTALRCGVTPFRTHRGVLSPLTISKTPLSFALTKAIKRI